MEHRDHVRLISGGVPGPPKGDAKGRASDHPVVWADFGSGQGAFTLALAELLGRLPTAEIHSVDRDGRAQSAQQAAMAAGFPEMRVSYHTADFTRRLELPALDGLVMANALHFIPDGRKAEVVRLLKSYLREQGRMILVEYNVDRGNPWVPHPLSYSTWEALAGACGFASTRLLETRASSFLHEFYSAVSIC